MAEYKVRRAITRFFEYIGEDENSPGEDFNIDATPHYESVEELTFDSVRELAEAMRRDGVTFNAGDSMERADLPDGSFIISYATAERETCCWDCTEINPAILDRVLIPAVDGAL